MSRPPMILLAASTRFLAESVLRAGFQPICFDLFADTDLDDVAEVNRVESFAPEHLAILFDTLAKYPQAPISYGGGIENFPDLIAQLEQTGRLAGANSASVNMVRDLATIERLANQAGLSVPKYARTIDAMSNDRSWLMKPIHSAGGIGIRPFSPAGDGTDGSPALPVGYYGQERIAGVPASAIYWARNDQSVTRIGSTYQHVYGDPETFYYAGNRWALDLPPDSLARLDAFAHLLGTQCNLVGVFGVDFMVNSDRNEFYILEVNPRVPASMELFEPQLNAIELHLCSFGFDSPLASIASIRESADSTKRQANHLGACASRFFTHRRSWYGPIDFNNTSNSRSRFCVTVQTIVARSDLPTCLAKVNCIKLAGRWCTLLCFVAGSVTRSQLLIDGLANALAKRIASL